MTENPITSGQQKQYKRFVEDAADKALAEVGLDKDELQKLIENGDEFSSQVHALVKAVLRKLSLTGRFSDEEVPSNYGYPSEYRVKDLVPQSNDLRVLFHGVGFFDQDYLARVNRGEIVLPKGAEN